MPYCTACSAVNWTSHWTARRRSCTYWWPESHWTRTPWKARRPRASQTGAAQTPARNPRAAKTGEAKPRAAGTDAVRDRSDAAANLTHQAGALRTTAEDLQRAAALWRAGKLD